MGAKVVSLPGVGGPDEGRRAYEAAERRRGNYHWLTGDLSADAEIVRALPALRQRARDLVRNNAYAARAVQILASNIVGDGIKPEPKGLPKAAARRVMDAWEDWAGEIGFDALQALAVRSMVESGECLVRRYSRRPGTMPVPLMLRVIEGDYLDGARQQGTGVGRVVAGIQFSPVDDVEGYWLFDRHPGDVGPRSAGSSFVSAESISHLYRADRPGQTRGVSWLAPVISMLRQVGDYQDAAIMKAKIEACFVMGIERDADAATSPLAPPESAATKEILDLAGSPVERAEPGMMINLRPGEKLTSHTPGGQGDFEPFLLHLLYAISAGVGTTFDQLTGDLRKANFSSLRAGKIEQRRLIEQWQYHLVIPRLCRPVWRWFIKYAVDNGALPARKGGYPVEWIAPKHEPIEPLKDAQAVSMQVQAGLKPLSHAVREMGWNFDDLLAAYATDAKKMADLGLEFSISPTVSEPGDDDTTTDEEGGDAAENQ